MTESVLQRQLRRLQLCLDHPPDQAAWTEFVQAIEATYTGYEQDRYLLERALSISNEELHDLDEALRRDRERLRAVINAIDVGLIILTADLDVGLANPEAARIIGATTAQLRSWTGTDLLSCGEADTRVHQLLQALTPASAHPPTRTGLHDARLRGIDGRIVPVSISVVPVQDVDTALGAVVVLRDLSAQRQLEAELRQAQKLEAVGRLASGIAHELNTPIQFIGDNIRFLHDCLPDLLTAVRASGDDLTYLVEDLPEAVDQSLEGVARVTSTVRAMKSFVHPGSADPTTADLNQALRDTVTVAGYELKDVADVELVLGELPPVRCLIHDLKQVFLNLLVNAAHAVADRQRVREGAGHVVVRTRVDGEDAVVEISDNGCGIPDEVADRVFEPFFTTKEVGRGSGLGLTLARSIILESHHGTIDVRSQPMVGTTLTVRLPIRGSRPQNTTAPRPTASA
ncbi:MAG TPA: ATP-binding protein [Kineosporiaceae bacterium]|nr:ATP-binding protein [Kineosporiaceae bacterium]